MSILGWNSFSQAKTTEANASLISTMSISDIDNLARSRTLRVAGIGAVNMYRGSSPANEKFTKRARGVRPSARHFSSLMINSAAAPSVICDEFPAVTRPPSSSGRKAVFNFARLSMVVSRKPSSLVIMLPSASLMGKISRSKRPSAVARAARDCDCTPKRSMSSRLMPHLSAIISADTP